MERRGFLKSLFAGTAAVGATAVGVKAVSLNHEFTEDELAQNLRFEEIAPEGVVKGEDLDTKPDWRETKGSIAIDPVEIASEDQKVLAEHIKAHQQLMRENSGLSNLMSWNEE